MNGPPQILSFVSDMLFFQRILYLVPVLLLAGAKAIPVVVTPPSVDEDFDISELERAVLILRAVADVELHHSIGR